jgi:hypothetical protein
MLCALGSGSIAKAQTQVPSVSAPASAAASAAAKPLGERDVDVRVWMNSWIEPQRATVGVLHLGRFLDPMYFLLKPIGWTPGPDAPAGLPKVSVPVGFVTDLASIPQFFWCILRPDGNYTFPAIVHDYLYWTQTVTRDAADEIFRLSLEEFGDKISVATKSALVAGVRAGGQGAWDRNARLREGGERRVLAKLPEDAKITWDEWKKRPGSFRS